MSKFLNHFATCSFLSPSKQVYVLSSVLSIFIASECFANKAVWYRYYDKNGTANISSTVTPAHIRNGYEALDANMQVIKRNRSFNAEADQNQSHVREQQARQRQQDMKLKRAYGTSKTAAMKRDELLKNFNKQIELQQRQLKQIQKDRIMFKRQEMEHFRKGQPVPNDLKDRLNYNMQNITNIKKNIESLQTDYRNTQTQYATIINRLKALE